MPEPEIIPVPPRVQDLTGKKFGRWTVIGFGGWYYDPRGRRRGLWRCRCIEGNLGIVLGENLQSGNSRSCGCLQVEVRVQTHTTHGDTGKESGLRRFYGVWAGIKGRCQNRQHPAFKNYGARGIQVIWRSYEAFKQDMLASYSPGLTIERIDNDGPYSKQNCKWATRTDQARNKRGNRWVKFQGKRMLLVDWAKLMGMRPTRFYERLAAGWPVEKALTRPSQKRKAKTHVKVNYQGIQLPLL